MFLMHNSSRDLCTQFFPSNTTVWKIEDGATSILPAAATGKIQLLALFVATKVFSTEIQQFVLHQHVYNNVPVMLFPYAACKELALLELSQIMPMHLEGHEAAPSKHFKQDFENQINTKYLPVDKNHAILNKCNFTMETTEYGRDNCTVKSDAHVIATWMDGGPLLVERDNVVWLNFCLTNSEPKSELSKLVHNTIEYLLHKKKQNVMQMVMYKCVKFVDVAFV